MRATSPWCSTPRRSRDQRGLVFPSPVVVLSIVAVAMAAIAFMATRGAEPTEREITTAATGPSATVAPSTPAAIAPAAPVESTKPKPEVDRSKIYVEVYNNSGVKGLAGGVAETASTAGWQVVGADNWYGTIPATTVYFPQRLERAAKRLALDLGIKRTAPAIDPMRADRLTVILTGPLGG